MVICSSATQRRAVSLKLLHLLFFRPLGVLLYAFGAKKTASCTILESQTACRKILFRHAERCRSICTFCYDMSFIKYPAVSSGDASVLFCMLHFITAEKLLVRWLIRKSRGTSLFKSSAYISNSSLR